MRRRVLFGLGGVSLAAATAGLVLGGLGLWLQRQNAALQTRVAQAEARLAEVEADVAEGWEGLTQVRAEEAKIRQWLGLDPQGVAPAAAPETGGGRGSLGDVDLATVAPEELAEAGVQAEGPSSETSDGGLGVTARGLALDLAELADQIQERRRYWDAIPTISPVHGEHWLSSRFGWRASPFNGEREFHSGADLAGARGTPVVAAAAGTISRVVKDASLGRAITVDHGNGLETIYGHLDRALVREGQRVARGQQLGTMGSTGRRSTGPHLHYAVRLGGKYVNPETYLLDREVAPYSVARH